MTKEHSDYRKWTNEEIHEDSQGYLAAQQATREREDAESAKEREEIARLEFERQFVAAGGSKSEADKEWKRYRNETAAQRARRADQEAAEAQRRHVSSRL